MRSHVIDQEFRHPRFGIANDEHIGVHGFERVNCVQHGLALGPRAQMLIEIEYVRAEPPAGEIEGGSCARARFEKEVGDRDAGKFTALVGRLPREGSDSSRRGRGSRSSRVAG